MRALNAAEESNRLAKDANRLSEHANAVSGRALAKETEDWHVEWSCKWLGSASAVVLLNKGRDIAHNVQVVVIYESIHENREAEGDMRPGGRFEVFLPQISQRVSEHRARVLAIQRRLMDSSPNAPVGPEYQQIGRASCRERVSPLV